MEWLDNLFHILGVAELLGKFTVYITWIVYSVIFVNYYLKAAWKGIENNLNNT